MWLSGESVLCECLAHGLWDHNKAVLSVGSVCEDTKLRLQAEELVLWQEGAGGLVKIHFSGKSQLCEGWIGEDLFLWGSRAWVFSALRAI